MDTDDENDIVELERKPLRKDEGMSSLLSLLFWKIRLVQVYIYE